MPEKPKRIPGPDHPITIEPAAGIVNVRLNGVEIANSQHALALHEGGYPVAYYLPRDDVEMRKLAVGKKQTYCPYKGEATHFDIDAGGHLAENAAWSYDRPFDAVSRIGGHIAFYRDLVDIRVAEI